MRKDVVFWLGVLGLLIALCVVSVINETYTKVNGEWLTNTPVPTPTSAYFTIKAEILSVELVGNDFAGYATWVTMQVLQPKNRGDISRPTSIRLNSSEYAYLRQKEAKRIEFYDCLDVGEDGQAYCKGGYKILGD